MAAPGSAWRGPRPAYVKCALAFPKLDSPYYEGQDLHDLRRAGGSTGVWILQMREEAVTTTRGQGEADRREVRLLDGLILLLIDKDCKTFRKISVWVTGLTVLVDERHQTCSASSTR